MEPNTAVTLALDFEFDFLDGKRIVWQVGGIVTTPTENLEFQYDVSMVEGKGIGSREGLLRLLGLLEKYQINIVRCHNTGAERSVLKEWCAREGLNMPKIIWIDTLALARKTLPAGWKLGLPKLLQRLNLNQGGESHTALPDARGCNLVFERLLNIRHGKIPMPN